MFLQHHYFMIMCRRILIIFLIFLPCHVQSVKHVVNCKLTLKKFFMQHMLEADKSLSPVKTQLIKIMVTVMVPNLSNGTLFKFLREDIPIFHRYFLRLCIFKRHAGLHLASISHELMYDTLRPGKRRKILSEVVI